MKPKKKKRMFVMILLLFCITLCSPQCKPTHNDSVWYHLDKHKIISTAFDCDSMWVDVPDIIPGIFHRRIVHKLHKTTTIFIDSFRIIPKENRRKK
jgi:hypothetical protein